MAAQLDMDRFSPGRVLGLALALALALADRHATAGLGATGQPCED
jgi:hypothetical protein